jgi:integrase
MARTVNRLTDFKVRQQKKPGLYLDGAGLYLQVSPSGTKSWIFRFTSPALKKARDMGLGPYPLFSLQEARQKAMDARKLLSDSIDPIEHRNARLAAKAIDAAKAITFDQCAAGFVADRQSGWTPRHKRVWENSIRDHVSPVFGKLPVAAVDTALVLKVLKPLWTTKHVTAKNLRERIEATLDWARAHKYRDGENPARWKGHLDKILDKPDNVHITQHHPALPYAEINKFMAEMRDRDDRDGQCMQLLVLTATRVGAMTGARIEEFDLKERVWTVPASRMKRRGKRKARPFRVPLSDAAVAIVERTGVKDGLLFPGASDKSLARAHGRDDMTTHGLRSTFQDWARERTNFPREVCEMAISHEVASETEEAYFRSDLLDKRRKLMDAWAGYCARPATTGEVIPLQRAGR